MMRESTWHAAKVWQWLCGLVGVLLIAAGVANQEVLIALCGLVLVGFTVLMRWLWGKVPTGTDADIDRMR